MRPFPCLAVALVACLVAPVALGDEAVPADPMQAKSKLFFTQHDADEDGRLSRAEYPSWLLFAFDRTDRDRDGFVTPAEDLAARRAFRAQAGASRRVPEGVTAHRDLEYATVEGKPLRLDLYLPKASDPKPPLLVWIHGGGWRKGSKRGVNPTFVRLVGEGYAAASIDYRLEGLASHPKQVHDCKGALRWLRAKAETYGYDPERVAVGGGSAGGHLSLLLGLSSGIEALEGTVGGNAGVATGVKAIVDLYGPADLPLFATASARFARELSPETLAAASPLTYLTADDPPVLILHGDRDALVPVAQSREVERRYREAGLECTLHVIEGAGHGGRAFGDDTRYELVKTFLDRHLKAPATE